MNECPGDDELVRMVEGAIGDASLAHIEAHADGCERCARVIAELGAMAAPSPAPSIAGRYELARRIAAGGMGEVWAAWDPQLRREIAIKIVRPDRADDGRERERLLREARALARLTHPNVLAVFDVGEVDGQVFLATELVAGDTLATRGGANADWRGIAALYAQAARGLAAAHAAGLVHRDVKPANLLVGADGRVRVADFGLAVRSRTPLPVPPPGASLVDGSVTATGHIVGTPAYMAPEQRLGTPADARADQYAFSVAIGEAIAGRRPSVDDTADSIVELIGDRRPREAGLDALCAAIARGLAFDPTARHADMAAYADAIDSIIVSTSASSQPSASVAPLVPVDVPATEPGTTRATPARRASLLAIGIVAAATAGGVAVWLATRSDANASSSTGSPITTLASQPTAQDDHSATIGGRTTTEGATPTADRSRTANGSSANDLAATARTTAEGSTTGQPANGSVAGGSVASQPTADGSPGGSTSRTTADGPATRTTANGSPGDSPARTTADGSTNGGSPNGSPRGSTTRTTADGSSGGSADGSANGSPGGSPARTPNGSQKAGTPRVSDGAPTTTSGGARPTTTPVPTPNGDRGSTTASDHGSTTTRDDSTRDHGSTTNDHGSTTTPDQPPDPADPIAAVEAAVKRHDGKACRGALTSIGASTDRRVRYAHAGCEMVAGNCEGGTRLYVDALAKDGLPGQGATIVADQYCPPGDEPKTRLRRLVAQTTSGRFDCEAYVAPARAAGRAAAEGERVVVGTVLANIARCMSSENRCDAARAMLDEAKAFIPGVGTSELTSACR